MEVGTVQFTALVLLFAGVDLVVSGVILLFFPAVAIGTSVLVYTTIRIRPDKVVYIPVLA